MGDSTPTKDRHLKAINPQKRRMPDVILQTRNVMIPVMKPVPFKQSYDTYYTKNKCQFLRAQNYKNNPALLFSETPLRTLYNPLEVSLEVKRTDPWKAQSQSTKYAIFGKTESPSIKKYNISQNSYSLKRLSCTEKNNALHFPNTLLVQSKPSTNDKNLHQTSSRSIKLSRKCNLSQMKESQTKHEDISALLSKIETPVNSIMNKPVVSLSSQSFYDIVDTDSNTVSTRSSFKIENKKTFANIMNRTESISNIASNHLYPNSEHEINVLDYENNISSGNNFPKFAQSHLKSTNTNWTSVYNCNPAKIQNDNNNPSDETNAMECHEWDEGKMDNIKCSWKTDNQMPLFQRKELDDSCEMKIAERNGKSPYDCKIKYSWQVIGIGTQTSYTLLQDLLNNMEDNKSAYKCSIKYSWQIIGISTQASLHDYNDPDYWSGMLLTSRKNFNGNKAEIGNNETDHAKLLNYTRYSKGRLKKCLILNNQQIQTFAEKEIQADSNDCYAKYSWHNLIKQYL